MVRLAVSRRAYLDLVEIERYSAAQWGKRVAAQYMTAIEQGMERLRADPGLLRLKPGVSECFHFYRVKEHFLVCALEEEAVLMLTVKHGVMDLPEQIGEEEPQLLREAEMLKQMLAAKRRD